MKSVLIQSSLFVFLCGLTACSGGGGGSSSQASTQAAPMTVTYDGNGNTGGIAPADPSSPYMTGATVTVLGNTGALVKTGYTFLGWNTSANGSGVFYPVGATFTMGASAVTLYAQWTVIKYSVTYAGNGNTSGAVPIDLSSPYTYNSTVTVQGAGTLARTGYSFASWNTAADGSGTSYAAGATFAIGANVTLYAQWTINSYAVTYNGNGSTSGTAPTDPNSPYKYGATVTVLGNTGSLVRTGYTFAGWNTAANGTGITYAGGSTFTMGAASVILYAQWTINTYTVTYNGNGYTNSPYGAPPMDPNSPYRYGATVTVLGNVGTVNALPISRSGYAFLNWNTKADGSGISYSAGSKFVMGAASVVLYAQWTQNVFVTDSTLDVVYECSLNSANWTFNCTPTPSFAPWSASNGYPLGVTFGTPGDQIQYAYVPVGSFAVGGTGVVYQCSLNSDETFSACGGTLSIAGMTLSSVAMATVGSTQYAYVTGYDSTTNTTGAVYQCHLNFGGQITVCSAMAPSNGTPAWTPNGVTFATVNGTQYAYVADYTKVYQCSLTSTGSFGTCAATPSTSPTWSPNQISFATVGGTQYAYVADAAGIYLCSLSGTGAFSSCTLTQNKFGTSSMPTGVTFATVAGTKYAFVSDNVNTYRCGLNTSNGAFNGCSVIQKPSNIAIWDPEQMTFGP